MNGEVKVKRKEVPATRQAQVPLYHYIDGKSCLIFHVDANHWAGIKQGGIAFSAKYVTLPDGTQPKVGQRFQCGTCGYILNAKDIHERELKYIKPNRGEIDV